MGAASRFAFLGPLEPLLTPQFTPQVTPQSGPNVFGNLDSMEVVELNAHTRVAVTRGINPELLMVTITTRGTASPITHDMTPAAALEWAAALVIGAKAMLP